MQKHGEWHLMLEKLGSILCTLFVGLVVIYQAVVKKKVPESVVDQIQKHLPQLHMPQSGPPHRMDCVETSRL